MKKSVLFAIIFCFAGINSGLLAQQQQTSGDRKVRFEKFKAEREAYITETMQLTDDEKKAFFPLCNELQMKKFELNKTLRQEIRKINKARKDHQSVSEAEYKQVIELSAQVKLQEAQLEQEYITKFLQVVPAEKVFLYQKSEQDFGTKMVREHSQLLKENAQVRIENVREKEAVRIERALERAEKAQKRVEKAEERSNKRIERLQKQTEERQS